MGAALLPYRNVKQTPGCNSSHVHDLTWCTLFFQGCDSSLKETKRKHDFRFCFFVVVFFVTILDVLAATLWEVELAVRGVILWANHPRFHPEPQNKPPRSHSGSLLRTWRKLLHASAILPITSDARFMVGWASAWLLNFSRTRRVKNLSRAERKADVAIRNLSLQICTLHGEALGSGRRDSLVSLVSGLLCGPPSFSAYASSVR